MVLGLPRNYVNELLAIIVLSFIGFVTAIVGRDESLCLSISSGLFTGSVIGAISLTTSSLRKRRSDVEQLIVIGRRIYNRLIWLEGEKVNERNLYEIKTMISELDQVGSIYGRIWFIKKSSRERCFRLYKILSSINAVQSHLVQYRMTAEKADSAEIIKLNEHFESFFAANKNVTRELNELIGWGIDVCGKAYF